MEITGIAAIGAGLAAIGAGIGIGKIGGSALEAMAAGVPVISSDTGIGIGIFGVAALEAMARQPEHSGMIQTYMIIAAALVEGVALFGVVVALLQG